MSYKNITTHRISPYSVPNLRMVSPGGENIEMETDKAIEYRSIEKIKDSPVNDIEPGNGFQIPFVFQIAESDWNGGKDWKLRFSGNLRNVQFTF